MSAQSIRRLASFTSASSDPLLNQHRSKLGSEDDDDEHDSKKSHQRESWFAPLLVLLPLVIDSRDVSTKQLSLVFVHVREQRPAFERNGQSSITRTTTSTIQDSMRVIFNTY